MHDVLVGEGFLVASSFVPTGRDCFTLIWFQGLGTLWAEEVIEI
jgi:hypothetical protein